MAIKAIAMDIDGTLTNDQKVISRVRARSCSRRRRSGIKAHRWLRAVPHGGCTPWRRSSTSNHDVMLVAFNGAHVVDAQTDEVLFDQAMPADELHRLIDHLRNFDVIPMIFARSRFARRGLVPLHDHAA